MRDRQDLHQILVDLLGSTNVYFQPPPKLNLSYPCIIYRLDDIDTKYASNLPYKLTRKYLVTVIDKDPDSTIPLAVASLPMCSFDRFYAANNQNHNVFKLFF